MTRTSRWFLPLMATTGVTVSMSAPLEVLFAHEFSSSALYLGVFMFTAALGVIIIDVFGTRFVPGLDARTALVAGLIMFGAACIGMGTASNDVLMMVSRVLQGFGGGMVLGAGLQAAVRVTAVAAPSPSAPDLARSLGRFNAAFLFGGALGAPGGLLIAGSITGLVGYQVALVATGAIAWVVAGLLAIALPALTAPAGIPRPQIGLPRFDGAPGSGGALLLAMGSDFLRGGVLFTALPLAGAAREYSTITITLAIAVMSGVEIVVLTVAHRIIRRIGVFALLVAAFALGVPSAILIAVTSSATMYLAASALFGMSLAGATACLPVLIVAQVGESSAGLAKFRISAGIGQLVGMVGCAVLASQIGITALFASIAVILLLSTQLTHMVGRRMAAT
ncbi:MFS transporter [Mycolicibacterium mengxianglii]|uniref:MFS transporter n=1 Tax=Mycolicibacterium mengxianglii TaxID=2736649 RepID=UPI001E65C7FA|nr:MFS transporter [Mycolicibacterium mengxianglii]